MNNSRFNQILFQFTLLDFLGMCTTQ